MTDLADHAPLAQFFLERRLAAVRASAVLLTGFGSPEAMRPDERFELDREGHAFRYFIGDDEQLAGVAHWLGRFDPASSAWRWGFDLEPSGRAAAEVAGWVAADARLAQSRGRSIRFPLYAAPGRAFEDMVSELDFASAVALAGGTHGAYFVPGPGGHDFYAVRLETPADPAQRRWCSVCGAFAKPGEPLVGVDEGLFVCQASAREAVDILASIEEEGPTAHATPARQLCAFCGEVTAPVLGLPYYFACHACLKKLRAAL